jgi:hypothetical protein
MASHLNKASTLCIRLTAEQKRRTTEAAGIVSRQRRANITPSALVRELVLPQVDRIIAEEGARGSDKGAEDEDAARAAA